MRRAAPAVPAVLVALAAGCASGGPKTRDVVTPTPDAAVTTRVDGGTNAGAFEFRTVATPTASVEAQLPGAADQGFAALAAAYERVGLAPNVVLSDRRTYGVQGVRAPRRLNRLPLSRYLECGANAGGDAHADAWNVTLTAVSQVAPAGADASTLATQVAASARPVSTSGAPVPCSSTGLLERTINGLVLASFTKP